MLPKWSQKGSTWSQQGPKWNQKGRTLPKMAPKGYLKTLKNRCPKKGRLQGRSGGKRAEIFRGIFAERVAPGIDFGGHFGTFFHQKCD